MIRLAGLIGSITLFGLLSAARFAQALDQLLAAQAPVAVDARGGRALVQVGEVELGEVGCHGRGRLTNTRPFIGGSWTGG